MVSKLFKTVGTVFIVLLCVTAIAAGIIALIYLGNKDKPSANSGNQGTQTNKVVDDNGNVIDDNKTDDNKTDDQNQGNASEDQNGNAGNAGEQAGEENGQAGEENNQGNAGEEQNGNASEGQEAGQGEGQGNAEQPVVVSDEFALGKLVKVENDYYLELKNCNLDVADNSEAKITVKMTHSDGRTTYSGTNEEWPVKLIRVDYGMVDGVHNYIKLNASQNMQIFLAKGFSEARVEVTYDPRNGGPVYGDAPVTAKANYKLVFENGVEEPIANKVIALGDNLIYFDNIYLVRLDGCDLNDSKARLSVSIKGENGSGYANLPIKDFVKSDYQDGEGNTNYISLNKQNLPTAIANNKKAGEPITVKVTYFSGDYEFSAEKVYRFSDAVVIEASQYIPLALGDRLVYENNIYLVRLDGCDLTDPDAKISVSAKATYGAGYANDCSVTEIRSNFGLGSSGEYRYIKLNVGTLSDAFNTMNIASGSRLQITVTYTNGNQKATTTRYYDIGLMKAVEVSEYA